MPAWRRGVAVAAGLALVLLATAAATGADDRGEVAPAANATTPAAEAPGGRVQAGSDAAGVEPSRAEMSHLQQEVASLAAQLQRSQTEVTRVSMLLTQVSEARARSTLQVAPPPDCSEQEPLPCVLSWLSRASKLPSDVIQDVITANGLSLQARSAAATPNAHDAVVEVQATATGETLSPPPMEPPFDAVAAGVTATQLEFPGLRDIPDDVMAALAADDAIRPNGLATANALRSAYAARLSDRKWMAEDGGVAFAAASSGAPPPPSEPTLFARQEAVRRAFLHAWGGYERFAYGKDQLKPVSRTGEKGLCDMGLTLVDALDTMIVMDLPRPYARAMDWILDELRFDFQEDVNLFETTIRMLGGLLGAFDLSGDSRLLDKAVDLADRLMIAFDSPTGIPFGTLGLASGKRYNPPAHSGASTMSEVGTLSLEFHYLTKATGNATYAEAVDRVMVHLFLHNVTDGLYPMFIDPVTGNLMDSPVTLGARGDSLYEYLLKQFVQAGNRRHERIWLLEMYNRSVKGIRKHLVQTSTPSGFTYIAEQRRPAMATPGQSPALNHKMDHLVCFVPGMLALGVANAAGMSWEDAVTEFYDHQVAPDAFTRPQCDCAADDAAEPDAPDADDALSSETAADGAAPDTASDSEGGSGDGGGGVGGGGGDDAAVGVERGQRSGSAASHQFADAVDAATGLALQALIRPQAIVEMKGIVSKRLQSLMDLAANLTRTCTQFYDTTATGLAPEIVTFRKGKDFAPNGDASHSFLRPETVESLFVMYRTTGDEQYRDTAWRIFQAIEKHARVPTGGYSGLKNVDRIASRKESNWDDRMESFYLSETLKYLFLIFSDDALLPLDKYVFNTEAHPLSVFSYADGESSPPLPSVAAPTGA